VQERGRESEGASTSESESDRRDRRDRATSPVGTFGIGKETGAIVSLLTSISCVACACLRVWCTCSLYMRVAGEKRGK